MQQRITNLTNQIIYLIFITVLIIYNAFSIKISRFLTRANIKFLSETHFSAENVYQARGMRNARDTFCILMNEF